MDTKKILASKKTEKYLILGIVLFFILSLILSWATDERRAQDIAKEEQNLLENETETLSQVSDYTFREITVNAKTYNTLVADTDLKRIAGLSGVASLPQGVDGMLFVFPEPGQYSIWMKDMLMSLDIYWLDEKFEIVHQELQVSPDTYPQSFTNETPALYVLELPSRQ